jgi:hypothetical protein
VHDAWQQEATGLAAACLCNGDNVTPCQGNGPCLGLDDCGGLEASTADLGTQRSTGAGEVCCEGMKREDRPSLLSKPRKEKPAAAGASILSLAVAWLPSPTKGAPSV